jgi:hypothetical protein
VVCIGFVSQGNENDVGKAGVVGVAATTPGAGPTGSPAQQVFLIFTIVPQFFGRQAAKKREVAGEMRDATASTAASVSRFDGEVKYARKASFEARRLSVMRFDLRGFLKGRMRRSFTQRFVICLALATCATNTAFAQMGRRGKGPAQPAPAAPPPGPTLTKSQAVSALIGALAVNRTDEARDTLEQIVTGKMSFGAHNRQATQMALLTLVMRPGGDTVLLRLFSEPDDKLRPGDKDYPASAVRGDAARLLGKVGSPEMRLGLAKLHDQASPEVRTAIESALTSPTSPNFAAQTVLVGSASLPDPLKVSLKKIILDQNAAALKQALKITSDSPSAGQPPAATGGLPMGGGFAGPRGIGAPGPAGGPGLPAGVPRAPGKPGGPGAVGPAYAAKPASQDPVAMLLDMQEKMLNAKPVDPAAVARVLWQPQFVEALAAQLSTVAGSPEQLLTALGSIPLKPARERLRDYLKDKNPQELGKAERAAVAIPAPGNAASMFGKGRGGNRNAGGGPGAGRSMASVPQGPVFVIGTEWLDPGAVTVLKSLSYKDRPKNKRKATPNNPGGKRSALAEKRAEERMEKEKLAESQYEWRDAIERFVRRWDDRLSAVAEKRESPDAETETAKEPGVKKEKSAAKSRTGGSAKGSKSGDAADKKATRGAESKSGSDPRAKASGAAPVASVPLPFALRPGEHITKEFHLRWPEDLPSDLTGSVSDPLVVHYVQLQGTDEINRTAAFYRSATHGPGRVQSATREIPDGKWVDIMQRDATANRTRSIDVLITRDAGEPDSKRLKTEELTIQVLMVEVESFEPEPKSGETDKTEKEKEK